MLLDDAFKSCLTEDQRRFLKETLSVLEEMPIDYDGISVREGASDVLEEILIIDKYLNFFINHFKTESTEWLEILQYYPIWNEIRKDSIKKLKHIEEAMRIITRCKWTALAVISVGGGLMVASTILIPRRGPLNVVLFSFGAGLILGLSLKKTKSIAKDLLPNSILDKAKEIINKDQKLSEGINTLMENVKKLKKAQSEVLENDIVKDIIPDLKELIEKGIRIGNADERLNYIETILKKVIKLLSKSITDKIPIIGQKTLISLLIRFFMLTLTEECQILFDCQPLFLKSVEDAVKLINGIKGPFHKVPLSSHIKNISDVANEMEKEAKALQNDYTKIVNDKRHKLFQLFKNR